MTSVYEALADAIVARGVTAAFGLMGEETAWLTVALEARGVSYYMTRHEQTAVGMADGYARMSGKVGLALVSRGPGLTNALTTLVSAAKAGSHLVVIVGEGDIGVVDPSRAELATHENKYVNQTDLLAACGVVSITLTAADTASADLAAAFERAEQGTTIAVNLPMDLLDQAAGSARRVGPSTATKHPMAPDVDKINEIADLIVAGGAARPVILAGRGAAHSGAATALTRLGEAIGAVLGTTLMGKNLFTNDPFDIGLCGLIGSKPSLELLSRADLVLVFGSSLNMYTTARGSLIRQARVIRFDTDFSDEETDPDHVVVLGDAKESADLLADELDRRGYRSEGYRTDAVRALLDTYILSESFDDASRPGEIDPRRLMSELDKLLPTNRTVVVDDGHHWTWPGIYLNVPDPEAFVLPIEFFSIGAATGVALGAAVARPDRTTVYCVGDGGQMMTLADIDTAVRYNLPLITIVSDDQAFGSEVHYLQLTGFSDALARCESPSFEAIARAVGQDAMTVDNIDDLPAVARRVAEARGPLLVHCKINGSVRAEWVDFHFRDSEFEVDEFALEEVEGR